MAKGVFEELFGRNQKLIDELYDWVKTENNKDTLAMLDGALLGIKNIVFNRQKDLIRQNKQYGGY